MKDLRKCIELIKYMHSNVLRQADNEHSTKNTTSHHPYSIISKVFAIFTEVSLLFIDFSIC